MKLLIIDNETIRRGAQMFGQHFKEHLNAIGHHCKRIFLYIPDEETSLLPLDEMDNVLYGKKNNLLEVFPSINPWLCRKLADQIHDFDPDIVLLNGARAVKYGGIVKRFYYNGKAPFIVRVIDSVVYWNRSWIRQWYCRNVITPQFDGAVGVGDKALNEYRDLYRYRGPGVSITRALNFDEFKNCVSREQARNELGFDHSKKVVLFLGNISHQKRPDRFIKVFNAVHKRVPESEAWIVGDGSLRRETEALVNQLGLNGSVRFLGYQKQVDRYITGSDLLYISSDTEGVPGIALESHYLERPVVTTRVGDVGMVVIDGETGYICEPDDHESQIERIIELLLDDDKAATMGKEGKHHVIRNFNLNDVAKKYLQFFEVVIDQKASTKMKQMSPDTYVKARNLSQ